MGACISEPSEHQSGHRHLDQSLRRLGQELVVPAHPPVAHNPRDRALDHPTPGQHDQARRIWRSLFVRLHPHPSSRRLDDLHRAHPSRCLIHSPQSCRCSPYRPKLSPSAPTLRLASPIRASLHRDLRCVRSMDSHPDYQTFRIDEQMSLSSAGFLAAVVASCASFVGGLGLLWESMIAALGVGSLPSTRRSLSLRERCVCAPRCRLHAPSPEV